MWQAASDATSISSGSTASSRDIGARTTCGEDEPTKETPPSKEIVCAREYLPSLNGSSPRSQVRLAVWMLITHLRLRDWSARRSRLDASAPSKRLRRQRHHRSRAAFEFGKMRA